MMERQERKREPVRTGSTQGHAPNRLAPFPGGSHPVTDRAAFPRGIFSQTVSLSISSTGDDFLLTGPLHGGSPVPYF